MLDEGGTGAGREGVREAGLLYAMMEMGGGGWVGGRVECDGIAEIPSAGMGL